MKFLYLNPFFKIIYNIFKDNKLNGFGVLVVIFIITGAFLAEYISPYPPDFQNYQDARQSPSIKHPFGTDLFGRDILSRIIYGTRISIIVGTLSMAIASVIGTLLGLIAGYYGKWIDVIIMRIMDSFMAFPAILLALLIMSVLGPSLANAIIAVGIIYIPTFARLIRASALSIREKQYMEAARAIGMPHWHIMIKVILLNSLSPLIVQITLGIGYAILVEAGLSFLGLGVQPPTPAWGSMLGEARNFMLFMPWMSIFPGLAIFLTVIGFNLLGDGLREALDPKKIHIK